MPHKPDAPHRPSKKEKRHNFTCKCGATFPTRGERNSHRSGCALMEMETLESSIREVTTEGSECSYCGQVLSMDDVLVSGKMIMLRLYDGTAICSDCQQGDPYYEHKEEPMLYDSEVARYLQLRESLRAAEPHTDMNQEQARGSNQ